MPSTKVVEVTRIFHNWKNKEGVEYVNKKGNKYARVSIFFKGPDGSEFKDPLRGFNSKDTEATEVGDKVVVDVENDPEWGLQFKNLRITEKGGNASQNAPQSPTDTTVTAVEDALGTKAVAVDEIPF